MSAIKYRPEIDGLRALAIIPVVLFHLGMPWIKGGFVGVDVFFVISGFLITQILVREHGEGTFTIRKFLLRRIRRIIPALSFLVLCCLVAGALILFRAEYRTLGLQGLSVFLLISNFVIQKLTGGYWSPDAQGLPLLHTWSLSVEEQFYLLYPIFLLVVWRIFKNRILMLLTLIGCLSFAAGLLLTWSHQSIAFYYLPTRAWELISGGFLAVLPLSTSREGVRRIGFIHSLLGLLGVGLILLSCFVIDEKRGFPGYQALLPVIGAVLVIAFAGGTIAGSWLSSPPVKYVGRISYSLYLWHWPVIVFCSIYGDRYGQHVALPFCCAIIILGTLISYHLVETPTRKMTSWPIPTMILWLLAVIISLTLYFYKPHYDFKALPPIVWKGKIYNATPESAVKITDRIVKEKYIGTEMIPRPLSAADGYLKTGWLGNYGPSDKEIIVLGDSHGCMWASTIDEICMELGITVRMYVADGISPQIETGAKPLNRSPFLSEAQTKVFNKSRLDVLNSPNTKLVILACRYDAHKREEFEGLFNLLKKRNIPTLVLGDPPEISIGSSIGASVYTLELKRNNRLVNSCLNIHEANQNEWIKGNSLITDIVEKTPNAKMINLADSYRTEKHVVKFIEDKHSLYIDFNHLSEYGAMKAKDIIKDSIIQQTKKLN